MHIEIKGKRMYYHISSIDLLISYRIHSLLFFPATISALSLSNGASPSTYRRKIALVSNREWQAGGEQRKRKKLVSKGKLISGHFVSTRNQPSSASYLPLFRIEYSHFLVHRPLSRASNPADPIIILRKDRWQRVCDVVHDKKDQEHAAVLANLECK